MQGWEIPTPFRHVDLTDPTTWHNASIFDWFATRDATLAKIASDVDRDAYLARYLRAEKKLQTEEKKLHHKSLGPFLSGRQEARLQEIFEQLRPQLTASASALSPWEMDFLKASMWTDTVRSEFRNTTAAAVAIRALVEMAANNEVDLKHLREERARALEDSVGGQPGNYQRGKKNGYLPDPIELLQIYRLASLFATYMKDAVLAADARKLELDPFGAFYPCPKCGEKFHHSTGALTCCGVDSAANEIRETGPVVVLGSNQHREHARVFIHLLWQFGYPTDCSAEQFARWRMWRKIRDRKMTPATFAREMLAFVFACSPESIRRKLTRGVLTREYEKHRIPPQLREYAIRESFGAIPANLSPCGWYRRPGVRSRGQYVAEPEKRIGVYRWSPALSYRSPLAKLIVPSERTDVR